MVGAMLSFTNSSKEGKANGIDMKDKKKKKRESVTYETFENHKKVIIHYVSFSNL